MGISASEEIEKTTLPNIHERLVHSVMFEQMRFARDETQRPTKDTEPKIIRLQQEAQLQGHISESQSSLLVASTTVHVDCTLRYQLVLESATSIPLIAAVGSIQCCHQ